MSEEKSKKRLWIWILSVVALLLLLRLFLPVLLEKAFVAKMHQAEQAYGLQIRAEGVEFSHCSLKGTFVFSADSIRMERAAADSNIIRVLAPEVRMRAWKGLHKVIALRTFRAAEIFMRWTADGTLTEARQAELQFVADRMLERGLITEAQHADFNPQVRTVQIRHAETEE